MLNALITGILATDPKAGTSKSGTEWANCVVRCPCGKDKETGDSESAFVQVAAFGTEARKLARLTKGDALSATGALKPSEYQAKDGSTRHGLSLTATGILTAYGIAKKRGDSDRPKQDRGPDREQIAAYAGFARQVTGKSNPRDQDFNDAITF